MNTDNLETLTDPQLSEVFALEVAGDYIPAPFEKGDRKHGVAARFVGKRIHHAGARPMTPTAIRWKDGSYGGIWKPYATSVDAVLPYLERRDEVIVWRGARTNGKWFVSLCNEGQAEAATLARAACIALIRGARAEKGRA